MKLWFIWDVKRFLLHIPVGILFYVTALVDSVLALGTIALFVYYEYDECKHIKDEAYKDIQGAIGGIILMLIGHLLWR